jgi:serine phosphatase RsbU (regulator of sigma subunit)
MNTHAPPLSAVRELSFRTKLVISVCGLVLLTGAVVTWLAHRSAVRSTEVLTDTAFREASAHAVDETRAFLERATPVVETLHRFGVENLAVGDTDKLARQLLVFLQSNPGLSWVSVSDESGTFTGAYRADGWVRVRQTRIVDGKTPTVEYEVLPDDTWRLAVPEYDSKYDPRVRPWYTKTKAVRRLVWLEPYIFYDQGIPGISCAAPLEDRAGHFRGVVTADFDLNALSAFVAKVSVSPNSRFFLYTTDETLLAHPTRRVVSPERQKAAGKLLTLADTDDPLVEAFRGRVSGDALPAGSSESFQRFQFDRDGVEYLASATAFRVGDDQVWVVGAVAPKSDFLADVWRSQAGALLAAAGALLVAVFLAGLMARSVSTPVLKLIALMNRVGGGDLEAKADFGGSTEFRRLADALNRMIADLRDRLRLRHSLDLAMQVQQQLLPRRSPKIRGLDVAGHSTYCDETGGDYYDFLVVDEAAPDHLLIALGDVMGHGVAAALVMAGVRAVLRDRAGTAGGLSDLLRRLNQMLAADHDGARFMTMHLSMVDVRAATFRSARAGHDPALIFDPAADRFEEEKRRCGFPLGITDDAEYAEETYAPLRPGQVIVIGTDGVWESPNPGGEQFGKERMREAIRGAAAGSAAEIVQAILDRLATFRGECRPVDDVTFVVLKMLLVEQAEIAHADDQGKTLEPIAGKAEKW